MLIPLGSSSGTAPASHHAIPDRPSQERLPCSRGQQQQERFSTARASRAARLQPRGAERKGRPTAVRSAWWALAAYQEQAVSPSTRRANPTPRGAPHAALAESGTRPADLTMASDQSGGPSCPVCLHALAASGAHVPIDLGCGHVACDHCLAARPDAFLRCPECRAPSHNPHVSYALVRVLPPAPRQAAGAQSKHHCSNEPTRTREALDGAAACLHSSTARALRCAAPWACMRLQVAGVRARARTPDWRRCSVRCAGPAGGWGTSNPPPRPP